MLFKNISPKKKNNKKDYGREKPNSSPNSEPERGTWEKAKGLFFISFILRYLFCKSM